MNELADELSRVIDAHCDADVETLMRWSAINSGTTNLDGLKRMSEAIVDAFAPLGVTPEWLELPPAESIDERGNLVRSELGRGIHFVKRPDAPRQVFLCIHYDTVFDAQHPFQVPQRIDANTINGPGACDAKGGLVVMLAALRAIEVCSVAKPRAAEPIGWEVYLNPDEEIGSPGSAAFFREAGERHDVALLFEPALADGSLVGSRKGSGEFTVVVHGRAAHAGRDFHAGRSATVALAEVISRFDALNRELGASAGDVTVNCGKIDGGGAVNIVPDLAIGRFNVRVGTIDEMRRVEESMRAIVREVEGSREGIRIELHGSFASPPKVVDERSQRLFDLALDCGRDLGMNLSFKPSGGTCDGNKLSAAGLAVLDSLGVEGGEIHSDREFVRIDSIARRAKLTALILARLAEATL